MAEDRKTQVDFRFRHAYRYSIVLEIPEGYRAVNVADLEKTVKPDTHNNSIGFTTAYRLEGNTLTVDVDEWYDQLTYPKEHYRYVIDVTNAAADFNKDVLVLEKVQ